MANYMGVEKLREFYLEQLDTVATTAKEIEKAFKASIKKTKSNEFRVANDALEITCDKTLLIDKLEQLGYVVEDDDAGFLVTFEV